MTMVRLLIGFVLAFYARGEVRAAPTVEAARLPVALLRAPEVQAELQLDTKQISDLAKAADKVDLSLWQLRDLPSTNSLAAADRLFRQFSNDWRAVLRPSQTARVEQLLIQLTGWQSLQLPALTNQLNLTSDQRQKYERFMGNLKSHPIRSAGGLAEAEHRWERETLTEPQRQKLEQLVGPSFDFAKVRWREVKAPELRDVDRWINSEPLTLAQLRGKVVILNFWTFGCINCIHNLPHYKQWYDQLPRDQVVILGIHTPETPEEYDLAKVQRAVAEKQLHYPIATDNHHENWNAWGNDVWPSVYLIDKQGFVRYWWYGELNWQGAHRENVVRKKVFELLSEKETGDAGQR